MLKLCTKIATPCAILGVPIKLALQFGPAKNMAGNPTRPGDPNSMLEMRATSVNESDYETIKELAAETVKFPHRFSIPALVAPLLQERLACAEKAFYAHALTGITTSELVDRFNNVVERLHLPDTVKTSVKQIQFLRTELFIASPRFMASKGNSGSGSHLTSPLSPIQATHLLLMLVDQKLGTPFYQVPPAEWDNSVHERQMQILNDLYYEKALALSRGDLAAATTETTQLGTTRIVKRRTDIRRAIDSSLQSLTNVEGIQLLNDVLSTLRLERL